ncbi:MAG: exosortase-associated EpsI family protein [Phycisphaeraceae bacterium]|nr:MAG: exosortase-associated EpsI family protein [Phycisphaeraceae bacterium]
MNRNGIFTPAFFVALAVLAISAAGFGRLITAYGFHLRKEPIQPADGRLLVTLPAETENWEQIGVDEVMDPEVMRTLGTENSVSRVYMEKHPPEGRPPRTVSFHAAYYTGMIDTVPHVPERCFVGGGMQKVSASEVLDLPIDAAEWIPDPTVPKDFRGPLGEIYTAPTSFRYSDLKGRRIRLPRGVGPEKPIRMMVSEFAGSGDTRLYAGYFFVANGGTVASAEGVRTLAFDLTSDYAYYLKVQTTSGAVGSKEELMEVSGSLVGELLPEIMRCVPDWIDVETGVYPADNPRGNRNGPDGAQGPGRG